MFEKVLIANRGEIALRIARACRELGIATVAVYSSEDEDSAVVAYADEAVRIGRPAARHAYLDMASIVQAALLTGAQAVHPGYGFLSEEADFARACASSGLVYVGPPPEVLAMLGDKIAARSAMAAVDVPMLPGSATPVDSATEAERVAREIGYPLIIKAAAGGGGRGMSVVRHAADLPHVFQRTRNQAQELFGDARVFIERYLATGRHIEVQILVDQFGNAVFLGNRDCTTQRRHQKLIEECPAPNVPADVAESMGKAALRGALSVGYVGVGTFEFLLDQDGNFYFLEVNCRIQVEHPVTEMVYGVDLVHEQFRIAAGCPMRLCQDDLVPRGAAIECRVNTEDPDRDFLPTPGTLRRFTVPAGPFVRVDTHGYPGYSVTASYDSLLAKCVVWGEDRERALARMRRALSEFEVSGAGVRTTIGFLSSVIDEPRFRRGTHDGVVVDEVLRARSSLKGGS